MRPQVTIEAADALLDRMTTAEAGIKKMLKRVDSYERAIAAIVDMHGVNGELFVCSQALEAVGKSAVLEWVLKEDRSGYDVKLCTTS